MTQNLNNRIMAMLHARANNLKKGEPLSPPIVSASKFALPGEPEAAHIYGRFSNPTVEICEAALSALEDSPTLAFPSGMAACTAALMAATQPGDHLLLPSDGYYTVRVLLDEFLSTGQRQVTLAPTHEFDRLSLAGFDAVWVETPSNPGLVTCDLKDIAVRAKENGALLIADNTTATPLLQRPLDLGADMVVSSDTKALSGHSDLLFGHIATRNQDLFERVQQWRKLSGSVAGPFEAFLVHRGLMTLELRLARMCSNAEALLPLFKQSSVIEHVTYPGFGFIIGLTFTDAETAHRFIETCPAIFPATSFGGIHTSAERRARWGDDVPDGYVRLSVGCEPEDSLKDAVEQALETL